MSHEEWIRSRFLDPPIELDLVVLGGSYSYGYSIEESDYDYFGYFQSEIPLVKKYKTHDATFDIRSIAMCNRALAESVRVRQRVREASWLIRVYTLEDWLWHKPIIETDFARKYREEAVRPLLTSDFAKHYRVDNMGGLNKTHVERLTRTKIHLEETGELLCHLPTLMELYLEI